MKRLVGWIVICIIGWLPAVAQHGRSAGAGSQAMGHSHIGQASAKTPDKSGAGKSSPTDLLTRNTKLAANLEALLPAGTKATDACSGFKNLGQCVAAVHVSHNLGLSFTDLKTKMLGTAATKTTAAVPAMSLGKAIQTLDPNADAKAEIGKATKQAKVDLTGKA